MGGRLLQPVQAGGAPGARRPFYRSLYFLVLVAIGGCLVALWAWWTM